MGPATNPFNVASGAPPPRLPEEPQNKRQKTHHDYGVNGGGYMGVPPQQLNSMQSQQQRGVLY